MARVKANVYGQCIPTCLKMLRRADTVIPWLTTVCDSIKELYSILEMRFRILQMMVLHLSLESRCCHLAQVLFSDRILTNF